MQVELSVLHTVLKCMLTCSHGCGCCRPPSTGDVIIFRPQRGVGRDSSWLDDNVFIKRIVAVAGAACHEENVLHLTSAISHCLCTVR